MRKQLILKVLKETILKVKNVITKVKPKRFTRI